MHQNGMLQRDESNMKHIYTAVLEEATTKGILSENFVDSHYEGSISKLLQYLFGRKKASPSELEAIKQLLNDTVEKNNNHK
jgi:predicted transcriptional regulator